MINANIKDLFNTNKDDNEIKKNSNDIYIYILISLIVIFLQINSLIVQYILLLLVLFFFSVKTGILFSTILFFIYNYKYFINNQILKYIILTNIIISIVLIIIDTVIDQNKYIFISLIIINIATIFSNIYCIFLITRMPETEDNKTEEKGGINLKKINLNYRK